MKRTYMKTATLIYSHGIFSLKNRFFVKSGLNALLKTILKISILRLKSKKYKCIKIIINYKPIVWLEKIETIKHFLMGQTALFHA